MGESDQIMLSEIKPSEELNTMKITSLALAISNSIISTKNGLVLDALEMDIYKSTIMGKTEITANNELLIEDSILPEVIVKGIDIDETTVSIVNTSMNGAVKNIDHNNIAEIVPPKIV